MPPPATGKQRVLSTTNTDPVIAPAPEGPKTVKVDLGPHVMVHEGVHYGPGKVNAPSKEVGADLQAAKEKADARVAGISEAVGMEMHPLDEEDEDEPDEEDDEDEEPASPPPPPPPGETSSSNDPSSMLEDEE